MIKVRITILTDPVPAGLLAIAELARHTGRYVKRMFKPLPLFMRNGYRGHFAVTRSLVEGLARLDVPANYNPRALANVADTVIVLSGVPALKQAIRLKRTGRIKRLLAGPNIMDFPSEHRRIICSSEVDLCITPSEWTCQMYVEECPELKGRCVSWPGGVDTRYWTHPDNPVKDPIVLIFEKQSAGKVGPIEDYAEFIRGRGYGIHVIRYGEFMHRDYLRELQRSILLVGFVRKESQGIAWAEAWSANVPTLIWRNDWDTYRGRSFSCSTAPYLTARTGLFFDGLPDFPRVFSYWEQNRGQFTPRDWVLEHMSDEACAKKLLAIAESSGKGSG